MNDVVAGLGERLVLVDVGASGGTPRIWRDLASHAVYVGFDPDAREIRETRAGDFARAVYVNKAVTGAAPSRGDDGSSSDVHFYLTHSPYCSSTLKPNPQVTESFLSAGSFQIEGECTAHATTIAHALEALGLSHVDWLKIDTQGTDLSIFKSLPDAMRRRLLAVDLEPGLRGAYVGEELFSDVHRAMQQEGFWLSRLDVLGLPRMRKATLDQIGKTCGLTDETITQSVRKTPGWVECRYLRTLESLAELGAARREYVLLWAFAFADQQWGYCLDVATEFARRFPADALTATLAEAPLAQIRRALDEQARPSHRGLVARVKQRVKSVLAPLGLRRALAHLRSRPVALRPALPSH
ncbi:MAG: FkbM family methyltransferase [Tepidisphaeraceae bacterium]